MVNYTVDSNNNKEYMTRAVADRFLIYTVYTYYTVYTVSTVYFTSMLFYVGITAFLLRSNIKGKKCVNKVSDGSNINSENNVNSFNSVNSAG